MGGYLVDCKHTKCAMPRTRANTADKIKIHPWPMLTEAILGFS